MKNILKLFARKPKRVFLIDSEVHLDDQNLSRREFLIFEIDRDGIDVNDIKALIMGLAEKEFVASRIKIYSTENMNVTHPDRKVYDMKMTFEKHRHKFIYHKFLKTCFKTVTNYINENGQSNKIKRMEKASNESKVPILSR